MRLVITKLGLLKALDQYAEIKVIQGSSRIKQILADIRSQKEEAIPSITLHFKSEKTLIIEEALLFETTITNISFLLKDDNQRSIILVHNLVFYTQTKHINIQHYYI